MADQQGQGGPCRPSRAATPTGYHGYTLIVQPQVGTVTALGLDGKPLWTLTGLAAPSDAVVLPGQRVLVVEQNRVTQRDVRGKIFWQQEANQPLNAHRLRNGNTFIDHRAICGPPRCPRGARWADSSASRQGPRPA